MSQRNAGHVVASHPGQPPDSGPVFTVLLTAAFDGVIVTMISFSASLPPGLKELCAQPSSRRLAVRRERWGCTFH